MEGISIIYACTDHKVGGQCVVERVVVQLRARFDLQISDCWEKIFTTEELCGMYRTWKEEIYQVLLITVWQLRLEDCFAAYYAECNSNVILNILIQFTVHADTVLGTQVPTCHTMQPYTDDDRMTNCATNEPHM